MGIPGGMFLQEGRMERRVCSLKDGKGEFSFVIQNAEIWVRGSSAAGRVLASYTRSPG